MIDHANHTLSKLYSILNEHATETNQHNEVCLVLVFSDPL